jgi:hypothetical protein
MRRVRNEEFVGFALRACPCNGHDISVGEPGDEQDREAVRREYALVIDAPDAFVRATIDGRKILEQEGAVPNYNETGKCV